MEIKILTAAVIILTPLILLLIKTYHVKPMQLMEFTWYEEYLDIRKALKSAYCLGALHMANQRLIKFQNDLTINNTDQHRECLQELIRLRAKARQRISPLYTVKKGGIQSNRKTASSFIGAAHP